MEGGADGEGSDQNEENTLNEKRKRPKFDIKTFSKPSANQENMNLDKDNKQDTLIRNNKVDKFTLRYDCKNQGPCHVFVESIDKSIGQLHPMTIN